MANEYSQYTVDVDLALKTAGAITASTNGTIIDLGDGMVDQIAVVDLTAITTGGATNESYNIAIEGSNTADMTTGAVALASKNFGDGIAPMDADLTTLGRYAIPFRNEEGGVIYRYIRLTTTIAGTAPSIDFSAFIGTRA